MNKRDVILSDITSNKDALLFAGYLIFNQMKNETQFTDKEMLETISEIAEYALEKYN